MDNIAIIEKKINNVDIKPIKTDKQELKIKGEDLFKDLYTNIFICAKKKSGKTTTINKILNDCCGKETNVIVFCSSFMKDDSWIAIKNNLTEKGINCLFYHSIMDGKKNILKDFIEDLMNKAEIKETEKEEEEEKQDRVLLFDEEEEIKIKKRKPKYIAPEYIFIFDDLADELKNPVISQLIKTHRHLKSKCIFSSQYILDLPPMSRRNQDYFLLFSGINEEKLRSVYDYADLRISWEEFLNLYNIATNEKYKFLYVDTNRNLFRKCFNTELMLKNE